MFENATFSEVLDDLASRFIINVPEEELQKVERIWFQIEQAHWFYDDFVREQNPSLPSMSLKTFAARMVKHCPLLSRWAHDADSAYQTFLDYKFKVPVCGAIILNSSLDKVLLVKGWSSRSSWGFPRGKINKDEPEWQCAQREVIEETGFDILPYLDENDRIEITQADQKILLYIIAGIPESTQFNPTTRKEISQIQWHAISELPSGRTDRNVSVAKTPTEKEHRYYLIKPFIKRIKMWISKHPEKTLSNTTTIRNSGKLTTYASSNGYAGSVVTLPISSGKMTVQDLFNTVNRTRSPVVPTCEFSPHIDHAIVPSEPDPITSTTNSLLGKLANTADNLESSRPSNNTKHTSTYNNDRGASDATNTASGGNDKLAALSNLMQKTGISATPPPLPAHSTTTTCNQISSPSPHLDLGTTTAQHCSINRTGEGTFPIPMGTDHAYAHLQSPLKLARDQTSLSGFSFNTTAIMRAYANASHTQQ